ncbi:hypothetical protein [Streptomyces alfalfae]|uniref:Uncharacterized protein n=1 Tax=Streptomyces alfalfae TaxID=1642299 RepID=A0A7T4PM16_9ACTN|nr:hypothetical protein [Streptomyces alfalfae]QQC92665.1 hypothetical protein I8755_33040 [Streptomyces alfalfae]QUI34709.1 hypothetical protein H9W91_30515 [Streptomyces alfalfae]
MEAGTASVAAGLLAEQEQVVAKRDNALLRLAREGRVGRENLRRMVQADLLCLESETLACAVLLARFPSGMAANLFAGLNCALRSLRPTLDRCATALALPPASSLDPSTTGDAFAFPAAVSWMCLHAKPAAAALALRSGFTAYGRECRELVRVLADDGAKVPAAFHVHYSAPPASELLDLAADVVEDGVRAGEQPARAASVTQVLLTGLDSFWQFAAEVERAPSEVSIGRCGR